jgi:hypothetical protein
MRASVHTFRCVRFCRWRIMSGLCWRPGMRISKAAPDETPIRHSRGRAVSSPPSLWPRLPHESKRQLAQHVGQLVQRLRQQSTRLEESHRAEHDVVAG